MADENRRNEEAGGRRKASPGNPRPAAKGVRALVVIDRLRRSPLRQNRDRG